MQKTQWRCSYISSNEFFNVIDTLDSDFPVTDHGEIIWVCGDQQRLWKIKTQHNYKRIYCVLWARIHCSKSKSNWRDPIIHSSHTDQFRFVACCELIEDVVAPLSRQLACDSRLLQQICVDSCCEEFRLSRMKSDTSDHHDNSCGLSLSLTCLNISWSQLSSCAKVNSDKLSLCNNRWNLCQCQRLLSQNNSLKTRRTYKTWGVVIPYSLGITISFQQWVCCNDLIFQWPLK